MGILNNILKVNAYINSRIKLWHCLVGFIFMFTLWFFSSPNSRPTVIFFSVPFIILFTIVYSLSKSIINSILISTVLFFFILFLLIVIALSGGH